MRNAGARILPALVFWGCLAATAEASLTWEKVPGAPEGEYLGLAAHGDDLAVVFREHRSGGELVPGAALRSAGSWERLQVPTGDGSPPATLFRAVALSEFRLAVAGQVGDPGRPSIRIWIWDRAARTWTTLPEVPASGDWEVAVDLDIEGDGVLLLSSRCRLLRWTGSAWVTPEGWPAEAFGNASCSEPFVRDSGRLFVVAGAIFEYRQGRIVYPLQPEGAERRGVAVLPEGLAFLQNGPSGYPNRLFLPGRPGPLGMPLFATGRLFRHGEALYAATEAGPVRLGEGLWTYTRPAGLQGQSDSGSAQGPEGPFVRAGGVVYGASRTGLFVGRPSVRRLLPVFTSGSGLRGETYRTELVLSNFGDVAVTARVELRAPAGIAAGRWTASVELPPGAGKRIEDLLVLYSPSPGLPATGSLAIEFEGAARDEDVWAGADVVASRAGRLTRTTVPAPRWGSGPGYYIESAVGPIPRVDPAIRTNVGWADAGDSGPAGPLGSEFLLEEWATPKPGPFRFFADRGQWEQRPLFALQPGLQEGTVLGLSGPAYYGGPNCCQGNESIASRDLVAYAVEVDDESGDGSMTLFETLSLDLDRSSLFFPAVVRTAGRDGTTWSTELRLGRRPGSVGEGTVRLRFRGEIGGEPLETEWTMSLSEGRTARFDAAAEAIRQTGLADTGQPVVGTLVVALEETGWGLLFGEAHVSGRRDGVPGAFGVLLPGIAAGRLAAERAIVPGLSNDAHLRSNLAVANAAPEGAASLTLGVALHRCTDGALVGSWETTLGPGERAQWNDVGGAIAGAGGDLYAVIRRVAGEGRFAAYGVVHDRASGDGASRPMTGVE